MIMNENIYKSEEASLKKGIIKQDSLPLNILSIEETEEHKEQNINTEHLIPSLIVNNEVKKQQRVKNKYGTPKDKTNESFSSQFNLFESENGLTRKGYVNTQTQRSRRSKALLYLKSKTGDKAEDDVSISIQDQTFMKKTFNKIRLQFLVRFFVDKMIQLLKRSELITFQCHKIFYTSLNDKAAFYDQDALKVQEVISQSKDNIDIQREKTSTLNIKRNGIFQKSLVSFKRQYLVISEERIASLLKFIERFPVFSTFSKFRIIWDQIQLMCLGFFFIFIPLIVVFDLSIIQIVENQFITRILVVLLLLDILINFNTSLFQQGREIKDHILIIHHYLKNGFVSDMITLISLIISLCLDSYREKKQLLTFTNCILLIFYFRFLQFSRVLKKIEIQYHFSPSVSQILRLVKLLLMNIYIIHLLSCFWILIAKWETRQEDTWISKQLLQNEKWYIKFMTSFYFNTVTMVTVGYGDIFPQTNSERMFSIITVLSACCVFAYSISEVGSIFQEMNKSIKKRKNKMYIINDYMKKKRITSDLQFQIRHYLEYYWNESFSESSYKEQKIIKQLSNNLKENLMIEANRLLVLESPFFRDNFSFKTISKTVSIVTEQRCTPEEIVFLEGEIDDSSVYFIEKGSVQSFHSFGHASCDPNNQVNVLKQGEYFGEITFFTGKERLLSFRSLEFTTLIKIDRSKFLEILKETPTDFERFCMIKDNIIFNNNIIETKKQCVYCKDKPHLDPYHYESQCTMLHFIPNYSKLQNSFKKQSIEEKRKEYMRNKQIKFNTMGRIEQVRGEQNRFQFTKEQIISVYVQNNGIIIDIIDDQSKKIPSKNTLNNSSDSESNSKSEESNSKSEETSQQSIEKDDETSEYSENINKGYSDKSHAKNDQIIPNYINSQKFKGKNYIIEEDDFETESPIKIRKSPKKLFLPPKQNNNTQSDLEEFELSSLEENQDRQTSHQSSLVLVNQILPFYTNSMQRHQKSNSSLDKQIENYFKPKQHPKIVPSTQKLFKCKTFDLTNSNMTSNSNSKKSSSKTIKGQEHLENQESNQRSDPKKSKLRSVSFTDLKKSGDFAKKTRHSVSNQVKFQVPQKKFKHRNSKSLQEFSQEREQIKELVERCKSEKNLKSQNSLTNLIKQNSRHSYSNKWYSLFQNGQVNANQIYDNRNKNNSDELLKNDTINNQIIHSEFNKALNNLVHQNSDNSIFNHKLDSLVTNFQKIQEIITHQNQDNSLNNYQSRFNQQKTNLENQVLKEFDKMKSFEIYFPYNNYENVLDQYSHKIVLKSKKIQQRNITQPNQKSNLQFNQSSNTIHNTSHTNDPNNNAIISEIFSQNSLNRLKLLRSLNNRKNSNSELLLTQSQRFKYNDINEISPSNRIFGTQQNIEEESANKIKSRKSHSKEHENLNLKIPNYFGLQSESQTHIHTANHKSRFSQSSNNCKFGFEQDGSPSHFDFNQDQK